MELTELVRLLAMKTGKSVKKSGGGYIGCCPAHDDSSPSLSLCEGDEGKLLINCFTGCSPENICGSLGIAVADLFPERIAGQVTRKRIEYSYHDEEGKVLFTKIRVEPGFDGKDKSFYWEREDENGNVIRNPNGCRKVLYQLSKLLKGIAENQTIFLVEGEKDVDKLLGYGLNVGRILRMKAILFARVSSREQEEGQSILAHERRLREYAARKGFDVEEVFKITESSTKATRKEFDKIIEKIRKSRQPVALIADTVDRIQRGFKESLILDDLRRDGKLQIHFIREGLILNVNSNSSEIMR